MAKEEFWTGKSERGIGTYPRQEPLAHFLLLAVAALTLFLFASASASAKVLPEKITENMTLTSAGNPYTAENVTIESGVTVNAEPGVRVTGVTNYSQLIVKGTLKAEGTAESPVVFTGPKEKETGEWKGIKFEPGSGASVLNHVEVSFGGFQALEGGIEVNASSPTISNSTIRKNSGQGIKVPKGGSPEIANNHLYENGGASGSTWCNVQYTSPSGSTGEVNIHGNYIEKGGSGICVNIPSGGSATGKTLSANTVIGTTGVGVFYSGPDIPGDITENTLSGNTSNRIEVTGTVAHSSTWGPSGSPLRFAENLEVAAGVTLTISSGALIQGGTNYSQLIVKGTLKAEGTAESPVVFTGPKEKETGEWKGIKFEPGSGASVLNHVEVSFGGFQALEGGIEVNASSPTISNSTIRKNSGQGIKVPKGGSPEIANNHLYENGGASGSTWCNVQYTSPSGSTGEVNIHGNYIEKGGSGICVNIPSGGSATGKTLSANTVIGTTGVGVFYSGPDIPGDITENTLSGNTSNRIEVTGTVAHSSTWGPSGSPLRFAENLEVAAGVTLTISSGALIQGGTNYSQLIVKGTLKAEGTAESPVVFTGPKEKETGEWKGIKFEPGSGASVLNHVEVSFGGFQALEGGIEVNASSPTISNSTIRKNSGQGIKVPKGGSPEIANNHLYENGGASGSTWCNVQYTSPSGSTGEVNIHGNYIEKGGSGICVNIPSGGSATGKTLSANTVIGTTGVGVFYSGPDIPGDITENTLSGNTSNRIEVTGTVAHSSTWGPSGSPLRFAENLEVAAGVTLTISSGALIQGGTNYSQLIVKGTLKAEGTAESPVVFTGPKEKETGEWKGIKFEPGSGASVLNHVEVSFGGFQALEGGIEVNASSPTISNSTIRKNSGQGIKVVGSGSPHVEWNRFRLNGSGLSYSGTGKLSAPNNDWSCASGPSPAGCGDSVTANVEWKPAVQLPELAGHCRGKESQCGEGADPVSLATGQLNYSHQDLLLTNRSAEPLEFTRAYTSGSSSDTGLGPGWSQTGLASATELESGKEVLVLRQDGRQDVFHKAESGYTAPSGVTDMLVKVEGTFQLSTLQGTVYRFDSSGRIASTTDSHGLKTAYAYNAEGRLATITDPSSQTLTFAYNGSNHITSVKDSTGREVKFGYSVAGDLETVTDALGGVTKYAYDASHRLTSITDPRKNVILKNIYDSQGRIVEQRDGLEHLWKLEYNPAETVVTEPEGGKRKYSFDGQDRVVSETDQLGNKTTIAYDEAGNVHEVVKPGGAKWIYGLDAASNLTSIKDPAGGERKYEYNAQNRPIAFTDPRGDSWSYEWSKTGDLLKIADPEKGETTFTYNESGQPLTKTDPDKHKSEFSYDSRGNKLSETDPLSHKTSFEYDSRSYMIARTAPGLKAEKYERDVLGDMLSRTTPEGNKTKYTYDANGLPTQVTDRGENVWKIERNAMERPTAYIDPLEQQIKTTYNGNLKPVKVVNRRGKETTYAYNAANQLTEVVQPEGGDWHFGYDARGNRSSMIDPREYETTYKYDLLDRMTEAAEPLSTTTKYGYDANGDLTSVTDPRGNTTSYAYDKLGHLAEVAQPLKKTTTYSYDAASNPLSKTTAAGTLEYGYDAANRLTEVSASKSTLRSFGYDAADRRTSAVDAEGHKIEIGYNGDGLVTSISDGRGQSLTRAYNSRGELSKQVDGRGALEYGYDKLGRLNSLTDPQGKALSFGYDPEGDLTAVKRPNGIATTNVYNDAGRLSETTSEEEPGMIVEALRYGYDATGNATSKLDARLEQETTYSYDALNQLTEFNPSGEGATAYGYDEAGNRIEAGGTTYSYNALNQLTSASDGTTYNYDGAGRMIRKENGSEKDSYEWDLFDHLAKAEGPTETTNYAYDGLERLSERKGGGSIQVVHYGDLTDLPTYIANGGGETTTSYVQGAHGLIEQRSGEATSYPLADAHGDITTVTGPSGAVESRQTYNPWGVQLSGPSLEMGFLGSQERPTDPTTGLIQMGARSYNSDLGVFASEDPVAGRMGVGASVNRYLYVLNNPLNYYDLNGRETCVSTPLGDVCPVKEAEDIGGGAEQVGNAIGAAAGSAWNFTEPGRNWIKNNAQDFWKEYGDSLERYYHFAGSHWSTCLAGGSAGAIAGGTIGAIGGPAGAVVGGVIGGGAGCAGTVEIEVVLEE